MVVVVDDDVDDDDGDVDDSLPVSNLPGVGGLVRPEKKKQHIIKILNSYFHYCNWFILVKSLSNSERIFEDNI